MDATDPATADAAECPAEGLLALREKATIELHGGETRLDPVIHNNPFPFYRTLREQQPVYYDPGLDVYLVTRHKDALQVLRDDVNFSLEHGYQDRWATGFVDELKEIMDRECGGFVRDPMYDPPTHTRMRALLEKAFTAHRVKSLEPRIRQIVVDLIEPLAEQGHADGIHDIGKPLTARIICEQLGFDFEDVGTERISRWTVALIAQMGRVQTREEFPRNAADICDMHNYVIPILRQREAEPREDMLSDLVHARLEDGEKPRFSFEEQVGWARGLLVAGNDTTAAAVANLMMLLAVQPGLAEQLHQAADDDRLLTRFVEEMLRIQPPVHGLFRTAVRDTDVGGTVIPAEAQVCIMFASANDDDAEFACPGILDVERSNMGRHLTFGSGIHRCIGAALARMEIKVAAREIVKRLDNIQLAIPVEDLTYLPSLGTQTLARLPLTFTRRA